MRVLVRLLINRMGWIGTERSMISVGIALAKQEESEMWWVSFVIRCTT